MCCEFCPTDESLQNEVMELYIAILIAIMEMMEWLVETGGCRSSYAASYNYAMQCLRRKGKQIKALCQGPLYGKSLDQKIKDVENRSASVQRCINGLEREVIARLESKTEQTVHVATDIKASTTAIQADTRKIKGDSALSRTGIARMEANQATLIDMIQKMQKDVELILKDSFRNQECKTHRSTDSPKYRLHPDVPHQAKTLTGDRAREARASYVGKTRRPTGSPGLYQIRHDPRITSTPRTSSRKSLSYCR